MVAPNMGLMFGPVGAALGQNLVMPIFTGQNFADFSVKWPVYLTQLSAGQGFLGDEVKLGLLSGALDEGSRAELQRRQEGGESVRYQDFWNWLTRKYGGDTQAAVRTELQALRPVHEGRLTLPAWNTFEGCFKLLFQRLENPSEEEAWSLILGKVPDSIRTRLLMEQEKRNQRTPTLRLSGVPGLTTAQVTLLMTQVPGYDPATRVVQRGQAFLITLP